MLKKELTTAILLMMISFSAIGQQLDQVTLKNGSIIRGNITEIIPGGNVTVNDRAGNTWVYAMNEIEDISKTEAEQLEGAAALHHGWVNITSIGFLAGSQSSEYIAPFSMLTSLGYKTATGLYSGLLTGIEFVSINHIPLMIDLQYDLRTEGTITPVAILRGGYTFPSRGTREMYGQETTYSGGIAGATGFGLKIMKENKFAWDVSLLYRYMRINYEENYDYQPYTNSYTDVYNRLEIRFGFYLGI